MWRRSCVITPVRPAGGDARDERGRPSARRRRAPQGPLWHPSRIEPCPRWIPLSQGDGGDRKRPLTATERTPAGRHSSPDLTCRALSVIGRFNSLIVGFISLFGRFICLFGRVGNLHSGVSQYQYLTVQVGSPDRPGIGFFAVFCRRPGTPIPAGLLPTRGAAPDSPIVGAERGREFWPVMASEKMTLDIAAARRTCSRPGTSSSRCTWKSGQSRSNARTWSRSQRALRQAANAGLRHLQLRHLVPCRAEPARLGLPGDPLERPRRRSVARAAPPVRRGRCYSLSSAAPLASSA